MVSHKCAGSALLATLVLSLVAPRARAYSTSNLITHHEHKVHRDESKFPSVYDPDAARVPCSTVNCPRVEEEHVVHGFGTILRRYPFEQWVFTGQDSWKFKHLQCMDFKEAFMRIMDYQRHNSYMQRKIPITTPLVVELKALVARMDAQYSTNTSDALVPVTIKEGLKLYSYLDPSLQDDPYAEPTEQKLHLVSWSPNMGNDWLAVYQWSEPLDEGKSADNDVAVHFTVFRDRLLQALRKAKAPPQKLDRFFLAIYGSPVDRLYELWVPVEGNTLRYL